MGSIVLFPPARNLRRVRAVAIEALDLEGHRSARFIRQACRTLFLELTVALGLPPRIARIEVQAFHEAVQAEMIRQTYCIHRTGGTA